MSFPALDAKAPNFTLQNQRGDEIQLADFIGKNHVVLYFYPKAMTPGCTVQACGLRDSEAQLAEQDAVVLAASPDPVSRLQKFEEKHGLNFHLLSDEDHKVADLYGAWGPKKFMGREYLGILRTTFIIDKNGRLKHIIDKVKTKTHHDEVLALLKQLG